MGVPLTPQHNLYCRRCDYCRLLYSSGTNDGRLGSRGGFLVHDHLCYGGIDHDGRLQQPCYILCRLCEILRPSIASEFRNQEALIST